MHSFSHIKMVLKCVKHISVTCTRPNGLWMKYYLILLNSQLKEGMSSIWSRPFISQGSGM